MRPGMQLIQQFIILHLNLASLCTGKELGEGATEEELAEDILYYYNKSDSNRLGTEALRFAGLSVALYSLPSELDVENESTREIYFEKCCLVFVPLETRHVLAVAQIGRRSTECHGATPQAVRSAIEESYVMFSMLRGGGILRRLKNHSNSGESGYPGMEKLYDLRKSKRKMSSAEEVETVDREIAELLSSLPINSIRIDLRAHYDAFISETTSSASQHVGVFRNIVQRLPQPPESSAQLTLRPIFQERLEQLQHTLLAISLPSSDAQILGVSTFVRGHLVSSHIRNNDFHLSVGETVILFNYLSSFRARMKYMQTCLSGSTSTGSRTPPRKGSTRKPFAPLALSLADFDDTPIQTHPMADQKGFLPPPPLALLSALDDDYSFYGPVEEGHVWMPPICLPSAEGEGTESHLDVRVALYNSNDFSALVFVNHSSQRNDDAKTFYQELLHKVDKTIMEAMHATWGEMAESPEIEGECMFEDKDWKEPGQDLILVDRQATSVSVYVNNAPMESQDFSNGRQTNPLNGLKKIFKSRGKSKSGGERLIKSNTAHDWFESNCADKRYLLAAHLSLDGLLAIDDLMGCIKDQLQTDPTNPVEMCTFLPQRWLYAYGDASVEIYAVLDTSMFVTVGDVLNAIKKVRVNVLGEQVENESFVK